MILVYIWFRFEWQFAVGAVVTLILDITKAIGFLALTRIEFDLVMVAAILTILGYSTNDKVVVYDRVRENLRKYKSMPLRELIDLSINETLNRTLGTSMTVFLASLPLALFGGEFDLGLRLGDAVRNCRRHFVFDLHRRADPAVPGGTPVAARIRGGAGRDRPGGRAGPARAFGQGEGGTARAADARSQREGGQAGLDAQAGSPASRAPAVIGRRGLLGSAGAAAFTLASAALISLALPIAAPSWHTARANRRLTLLIGATPDSAADRVARAFAPFLTRQLPFTDIALRNLPGEAGLTGFQALANAPPSGNTIGWVATPALPARLVDRDAAALLPRLRLLGAVQREPIVFVSPTATPLETVQDIVRRSGEDADAVPLGTPPPGSPPHLAALKLQALAGTRLNIVTFPSAAAARQAAIGGNLAAAVLGMADVIDDLRELRLAGLGIAAEDRIGALPDLPALHEAGLPLAAAITRGVAAPAGLPDDVADRLAAALQAVVADQDFRDQAEASGFRVEWIDGPAWTALVEAERAELAALWATDPWLQSAGQ